MSGLSGLQLFALYVLFTCTLIACLYLFVSVKRELRKVTQRTSLRFRSLEARTVQGELLCATLEAKLKQAALQLEDMSRTRHAVSSTPAPRASAQELRMAVVSLAQKGEAPDAIATALNMSRAEVELLLRVHRVVSGTKLG